MSENYAPTTPKGRDNNPKVGYPPARIALASTHKENDSVSSVLLFTHNTTEIEVTATGAGVAGRWAVNSATSVVTSAAGTPNFDFIVPVATVRRFVIPHQQYADPTSVQGVNRAEGLYQGIAYISITGGNASVLTAEF